MLQRSEIGSREHIMLWLGGKDPGTVIDWSNPQICAASQYAAEHGLIFADANELNKLTESLARSGPERDYRGIRPVTFGEVHEAAIAAWN